MYSATDKTNARKQLQTDLDTLKGRGVFADKTSQDAAAKCATITSANFTECLATFQNGIFMLNTKVQNQSSGGYGLVKLN
jgi:hypothetical protein